MLEAQFSAKYLCQHSNTLIILYNRSNVYHVHDLSSAKVIVSSIVGIWCNKYYTKPTVFTSQSDLPLASAYPQVRLLMLWGLKGWNAWWRQGTLKTIIIIFTTTTSLRVQMWSSWPLSPPLPYLSLFSPLFATHFSSPPHFSLLTPTGQGRWPPTLSLVLLEVFPS